MMECTYVYIYAHENGWETTMVYDDIVAITHTGVPCA